MYTGKRFQVQEWICNHQEYFWFVLPLTCNITFDKEFRYFDFCYICTSFYVEFEKYVCCKYFNTLTNLSWYY